MIKNIFAKVGLLVAILLVTPLTWMVQSDNSILQYPLGLFNGLPPKAFFPFFPWICYPLAGLVMAQVIKSYHNSFRMSFWFVLSVILISLGAALSIIEPDAWQSNFYRLGPGGTLWHLGAALAWMVLFILLSKKVSNNSFFVFLEWLSAKITLIYFTQWIIIIWLLPLFGFEKQGIAMSLVALVTTSAISFMLPYLWYRYKGRRRERLS